MILEDWFVEKNFNWKEKKVYDNMENHTVEKETEKALYVAMVSEDGLEIVKKWIPKSVIIGINNTIKKERLAEYQAKNAAKIEKQKIMEEKIEKGINYNQQLITFAKENGIKGVRIGMKTATLIEKIKNFGLEVPARG